MSLIHQILKYEKLPTILDIIPFLSEEDSKFVKELISDVNEGKWNEITLARIDQGKSILTKAFNK